MSNARTTATVHEFSAGVAPAFHAALARSLGDVRFGFKYPLLRLELAGLTAEDVEQLRELARAVFHGEDIGEAAGKLLGRSSASPLAVAITQIVSAAPPPTDRKMVLLGAILGAHAATGVPQASDASGPVPAMLGAITGAIAVSMTAFIQSDLERKQWAGFVELDQQ